MNWTYCTIQSHRLLAVAEPTFFLITEIAATFTRPYIVLKGFQQVKPDGPKLFPLGAKLV